MKKVAKTPGTRWLALIAALVISLFLNLGMGSVSLSWSELWADGERLNSAQYVLLNYRLPKALAAICTGAGLSLCGLLMQTLFRNPLAGPFVLGISSGAGLGAALLLLGSSALMGTVGAVTPSSGLLILAASIGSLGVLLLVGAMANYVQDTLSLLIVGLMLGSVTTALVGLMSYFSSSEALQQYIFWSFGSLGGMSWPQVLLLLVFTLIGIVLALAMIKGLDGFLLGEDYAQSMGISPDRIRLGCIVAAGLLAGSCTAFAGPIAFVGLAVPHIARQRIQEMGHRHQIPAVLLYGSTILLLCDSLAQWPGSAHVLPINAITSLLGAPVVIWIVLKQKRLRF